MDAPGSGGFSPWPVSTKERWSTASAPCDSLAGGGLELHLKRRGLPGASEIGAVAPIGPLNPAPVTESAPTVMTDAAWIRQNERQRLGLPGCDGSEIDDRAADQRRAAARPRSTPRMERRCLPG